MAFRENLKSELVFKGLLVRELSELSGISKYTIDNYLNVNERMPTAEAAVKIADVLGVTVEYLVTGAEVRDGKREAPLSHEGRCLVQIIEKLPENDRKTILSTVHALASSLQKHN
jgi:transcriptional regulator with XRE-family HTH domain